MTYRLVYGGNLHVPDSQWQQVSGIHDTIYTFPEKLEAGEYFWKVYAEDGEFSIPGFDNRNFFIDP